MKNFHLTYAIIALFFLIMVCVATIAFSRTSHSTGIDPAQIKKIREVAQK